MTKFIIFSIFIYFLIIWLNKTIVSLRWQCYDGVTNILLFSRYFLFPLQFANTLEMILKQFFTICFFFSYYFLLCLLRHQWSLEKFIFFPHLWDAHEKNRNKYSGECLRGEREQRILSINFNNIKFLITPNEKSCSVFYFSENILFI